MVAEAQVGICTEESLIIHLYVFDSKVTYRTKVILDFSRSSSGMAKIAFQAITKQFPGTSKPAVDAVSFEVPEGTTCMLVGTSGSGKTTLLRMVSRLIEPTSGEIIIDGTNVLEEDPIQLRRRIGYVIQQVGLFPHLNISENIRATAEIAGGWTKQRPNQRVRELLDPVGPPPQEY